MAKRYPLLRMPITLRAADGTGALTLPHRVVMGSMHLNLEHSPEDLAAFYRARVHGGAGLIVTGGVAVNRAGAGSPSYTVIGDAEHQRHWATVVGAVHDAGGRIALQLFHAGRYALTEPGEPVPVAPSAVYSRFSRQVPRALTDQEIHETIADFAAGAHAAVELGFDAVEVMGSEGYLLNQFASPLTNLRDDEWGGDPVRRRAFPVAVVRAVADAAGALPVIARTSGADLMPGSSTDDDADALAVALVDAGAAAIDVGIGWHESTVPTVQSMVPHAVWARVSARVRSALHRAGTVRPVIGSGRVNTLAQAETMLADRSCDLVSMARPFLADPDIIAASFDGREALVNPCIGCNEACIDRSFGSEPISCTVNPRAGREREFPVGDRPAAPSGRRVAVVGAGPAGMEAARAAASAGALVTLFEAGPRLGGQFLLAGAVPGKRDFLGTVAYFENELERLGVRVLTGHPVTAAEELTGFDHVILAAGVLPRTVSVPMLDEVGTDGAPPIVPYPAAFASPDAIGSHVAVIGAGGIAVDLAHFLVEKAAPGSESGARDRFLTAHGLIPGTVRPPARAVTIMRRGGSIGAGMGITTRWAAVQTVRRAGVRTLTGVAYRGIGRDGVHIEVDGVPELIDADTVIIAAGQVPRDGLVPALAARAIPHTVVGGARSTQRLNAVAAFEQGLRAGHAAARRN